MFALGLLQLAVLAAGPRRRWTFLDRKFGRKPEILAANIAAFKAGWNFGETTEDFARPLRGQARPTCRPATTATSPATWRSSYGLIAAAELSGLPVFLGAYPITPASDILHELSKHKEFGVTHHAGRGRDRRHRRGPRRGLRRRARA